MSKPTANTNTTSCQRVLPLLSLGLLQALVLSVSGCRTTSDNQIDLLERELRVQEDYIYELEGYVVDYSEKLRDCRGCSPPQMAAYSEELHQSQPQPKKTNKPARHRAEKERSIIDQDQSVLPTPPSENQAPEVNPEDLEVPDLDLDLDDPVTEVDHDDSSQVAAVELEYESADGQMMLIPDPVDFNQSMQELANVSSAEAAFADEETINEDYTDEYYDETPIEQATALVNREAKRLEITQLFRSEGGKQSPANLLTVVEALDSNDEPVDLNGEVSLMLMIPSESGKPKRLKRWNFTAKETISAWQSSDLGDGLHLELPLENTKLPETPIELWARLVTADGRKLLTQLPFDTNELTAMNDEGPQAAKAQLASKPSTRSTINPLRNSTRPISTDDRIKLADGKSADEQAGWRRSMQSTRRTAEGFATSSATATGWTKQAPGRLPSMPALVADRRATASTTHSSQPAAKPQWTSGRSFSPLENSTTTR